MKNEWDENSRRGIGEIKDEKTEMRELPRNIVWMDGAWRGSDRGVTATVTPVVLALGCPVGRGGVPRRRRSAPPGRRPALGIPMVVSRRRGGAQRRVTLRRMYEYICRHGRLPKSERL